MPISDTQICKDAHPVSVPMQAVQQSAQQPCSVAFSTWWGSHAVAVYRKPFLFSLEKVAIELENRIFFFAGKFKICMPVLGVKEWKNQSSV